jgi:uncharacterized protein YjbI with pentapeptide repeats
VEQQPKSRWRPTKNQVVWAIKVAAAPLITVMVISIIWLLWRNDFMRIGDNSDYVLRGVLTVVGILVLIGIGYRYEWTGFGQSARKKSETQEIQHSKTLWDWMSLLFVPLMIAGIGIWFTWWQNNSQQALEARQRAQEAQSQARNFALQSYLDQMQHLVLEENLPSASEDDHVSAIARARTLTVLRVMGSEGKRTLVQFLYESSLIQKDRSIISLSAADLSNGDLSGADLRGADLSGADLSGADLSALSDTNLSGADLSALSDTILIDADLSETELSNADLRNANLSNADLRNANLSGADLRGADLIDADLSNAHLSDANLSDAYLDSANLGGALLDGANLGGTYLSGADLRGADLIDADLSNAHLSDANLSDANLSYANLRGTDLSDATLSGANLKGAFSWTEEQLSAAKSLQGATMPNGQKYEE